MVRYDTKLKDKEIGRAALRGRIEDEKQGFDDFVFTMVYRRLGLIHQQGGSIISIDP